MPKFQNNTKGVSRVGHICKVDPNSSNAFLYVTNNATTALGVIAEAVPYRAYAEVISQGEALVYVVDNVRKDDLIRAQKSDNITTGSCRVAKIGDAPYLKIGTALESGKGLIRCSLNIAYISGVTDSLGVGAVPDGTYVMGLGLMTDGVMVVRDGVIISITEAT